jgi:hypothetical protein
MQGCVTLHSTIIAYNDGYGIFRDNEATTLDIILDPPDASKRNQFFNNQSGPLGGSQTIIEGNEGLYTIADPMFVAVDDGDFHLKPESPLYGSAIGYQYP